MADKRRRIDETSKIRDWSSPVKGIVGGGKFQLFSKHFFGDIVDDTPTSAEYYTSTTGPA